MASDFYTRVHADYEDLDNVTGRRFGFTLSIRENDGGVGISMDPVSGTDDKGIGRSQVFMTPGEAGELVTALKQAIERAESKKGGHSHKPRSREVL